MSFTSKLRATYERNGSLLCVGLDPDPSKLPVPDVADFCRAIIEATQDRVLCYKPNFAFFEQFGPDGLRVLELVRKAIPSHIAVIGDAKRGDIGSTASAYAKAMFEYFDFDAVTVSPYLGRDSLDPFLAYTDKTSIVLCHTSNEGASDLQDLRVTLPDGTSLPIYELVARQCRDWNTAGNVGLVVGATYPEQLAKVRAICPDQPILVPGIGAQQGDLRAALRAGITDDPSLLIMSASRQVLYASKGADFADAARSAAGQLRDAINTLLAE